MGDAQLEQTSKDERFMARAIDCARPFLGKVAPNPPVGCVIVKNGEIIAEGAHAGPGQPHAEVVALQNAGDAARGATAYVSLEPCNHTGRTGPCVDALINAGVAEVFFAVEDPNPIAAGGADRLRQAGIRVRSDVGSNEAQEMNRAWLKWAKTKTPYVFAKFAASLDGRTATESGDSKWITGPAARAEGHKLRAQVDAILTGANTVIADDPSLTARVDDEIVHAPLRIVLDSTARTSPGAKVYERSGRGALLVTTDAAPRDRLKKFEEHGVDVLVLQAADGRPNVSALLDALGDRGVTSLMLECGGEVLGSFVDEGLVDEVYAFVAPIIIGGGKPAIAGNGVATIADAFRLQSPTIKELGGDLMIHGRLKKESD